MRASVLAHRDDANILGNPLLATIAVNPLDRFFVLAMPLVPKVILRRLGGRYVAGANLSDAVVVGKRLQASGYRLTFDILGEAVSDDREVRAAVSEYMELSEALRENGLEMNLSCKPTQMGLLTDSDLCWDSVSALIEAVSPDHGFIRFEMEDSPTTDATLSIYDKLRSRFGNDIGCVLQSLLRRTDEDVDKLLESPHPLNVRMVKGIYIEPESIAYQDPLEINDSFLRNTKKLLAGGSFVGAATHDESLLLELLEMLELNPSWKEHFEFQMLLGVGENLRRRCLERGIPVRVYVPFGEQWIPYVQRRLRKNPKLARYALLGLFKSREQLKVG